MSKKKPPHQAHSDTSLQAAEMIEPHAPTLRDRVMEYIGSRGLDGATDEEVQIALRINANTQRPRRRELQLKGQVHDSGQCRQTRHARWAVVWVAGPPSVMPFTTKTMSRKQLLQYLEELEQKNEVLDDELKKMRSAISTYEDRNRQIKLLLD